MTSVHVGLTCEDERFRFDSPDPDGFLALRLGGRYYDEAMGYSDPADREARIDSFRLAEFMYLKSAEKGNAYAHLCLGYVYSYDRCEGRYFEACCSEPDAGELREFLREQRAFESFKAAADADIAEGCYKLGDMYKHGTGCEPDAALAFECYARAFRLGRFDSPTVWGSIALRLGDAYENGFGCGQSFEQAHKWYKQAVTGLEIAVNSGEWYYKRALSNAKNGVKRTAQELQVW